MGADGGIKITKISSIKRDWRKLKEKLVNSFKSDLKECKSYEKEWIEKYILESEKLPKNIDDLSNEEICKLFNYLHSCDCPYLYDDLLITGEGDYVADQMNTLSWVLDGVSIETWT